jgi:hypothetical protein
MRVAEQQRESEGEQARGGLVAGDQEGQHLIADVEIVEAFSRLRIDRRDHQVQEIVRLDRVFAPFGDDVVDQLVHLGDVGVELALGLLGEPVLDRQAGDRVQRLAERASERFEEAVELLLFEAVEAVAEASDRNRVEGQPSHVVGDEDVVSFELRPFRDQLVADFQDQAEIALHRALAEGGEQDAVRLAPVRFLAERGEQAVARKAADHAQAGSRHLAEARLVAKLCDQIGGRDEQADAAAEAQFENALRHRAGHVEQVTDQPRLRDLMEVADDRQAGRGRDAGGVGHVMLP